VPRVRHYLTDVLKVSDDERLAWIQHWLGAGLQAMETLLAEHPASGRLCYGDSPTVADICLVTQVTPAKTTVAYNSSSNNRRQRWLKSVISISLAEAPQGERPIKAAK